MAAITHNQSTTTASLFETIGKLYVALDEVTKEQNRLQAAVSELHAALRVAQGQIEKTAGVQG